MYVGYSVVNDPVAGGAAGLGPCAVPHPLHSGRTDLDSGPLLVGERFSEAALLFWGEEVVKEFPESEVLPLPSSGLLPGPLPLPPPPPCPGLACPRPRERAELVCVDGGEDVSLPESYSWECPRAAVAGWLPALARGSAADPDPGI